MLTIPSDPARRFEVLLEQKGVPAEQHPHYRGRN